MNKERTSPIHVINKATEKDISIYAVDEENALITVYILEEEEGKQKHLASWYRKKMIIIDVDATSYLLVLGKWSIKVEKKK